MFFRKLKKLRLSFANNTAANKTHFKLHSIRVNGKHICGFIWQYGHFIHDVVMPLIDWLEESQEDPKSMHLLIEDTPDQSIGPFLELLEALTGVTAEILSTRRFQRAQGISLELHAYLFGPYKPESFINIQSTIVERFDLTPPENPPGIVLIERGYSKHGFESNNRKYIPKYFPGVHPGRRLSNYNKITGAARRTIVNHAELAQALQNKYGKKFHNAVLEDMPIAEQVRLFYHARIIIGQHGAGLNNLIWMHTDKGVVVEINPCKVKTFSNMCLARGFTHSTVGQFDADKVSINPDDLLSTIEDLLDRESTHGN
ncbi:MAG: glycosyltransferase family 61 protein [Lentisphaeria bacterium]|nr:glycosyltransferase family 61 protein [Lentisphaeria bacterium]NQZ69973.1 glycosyltransferase family 61 protein [Lentisphaeria bacterium]